MKALKRLHFSLDYLDGTYKDKNEYIQKKQIVDSLLTQAGVKEIPPAPSFENPRGPWITYEPKLDRDSPEYEWLDQELAKIGIKYSYGYEFEFSNQEVEQSPLFWLGMNSNLDEEKHPINYGTGYMKEIICPHCGLKKWTQTSPLRMDTGIIKKEFMIEHMGSWHQPGFIIVSGEMPRILAAEGLTGYRLEPVEHIGPVKRKREVYQFIVENTLPPLAAERRKEPIINEYCHTCGLTGNIQWPLPYSASSFSAINDFNLTLEYLEYAKSLQRLLIISSKARKLLLNFGLKRKSWFQPVILMD